MSRSISISTEVFAAIWACRKDGEETEDAILRRIFGRAPLGADVSTAPSGGVYDGRNNVHFPEGFEIVRVYKRKEYRARAMGGSWVRADNGERFQTLNQLNETIVAGPENIWNGNWKYYAADRTLRSINDLRR